MNEQTATLVMDRLDNYLNTAQEVIVKYGGDAVDLGLNVLRIEAVSSILFGIGMVILTLVIFYIQKRLLVYRDKKAYMISALMTPWRGRTRHQDDLVKKITGSLCSEFTKEEAEKVIACFPEEKEIDWSEGMSAIPTAILALSSSATLIALPHTVLNIWNWVGIFWPEAYAVHKFLL